MGFGKLVMELGRCGRVIRHGCMCLLEGITDPEFEMLLSCVTFLFLPLPVIRHATLCGNT